VSTVDLASEMAAARLRPETQTANLQRDARVQAIRGASRQGSTRVEIEERARSFYPRLSEELLMEAIDLVCDDQRTPAAPVVTEPAEG
jgi:hypothetical protein